ncbi:hypothetical protein J4E83_006814 [Alternaria metachromatica]|uniref:uncharacterized protein n=1 Tax=Alternaria metachromatica TaxID=283354 RepID=UPI0020C41A93|nr:uncharacterized protein J4E83_006814 [Alternaria metachromatica]KAI4615090.1 hypothetical protein J4E83_006814 [Alternaria metachromatica]
MNRDRFRFPEAPDAIKLYIIDAASKPIARYTVRSSNLNTSGFLLALLQDISNGSIQVPWNGSLPHFEMYWLWLISHQVKTTSELKRTITNNHTGGQRTMPGITTKEDYADLLRCWEIGLTFKDTCFMDMIASSIIDRLRAWAETTPSTSSPPFIYALLSELVRSIYSRSSPETPIRRLIVDAVAYFGRNGDFVHFASEVGYPMEFVKEVMLALGKRKEMLETLALGGGGQPKSILKQSSGGGAKVVRFGTEQQGGGGGSSDRVQKEVFAENECAYHLHTEVGAPCWRTSV